MLKKASYLITIVTLLVGCEDHDLRPPAVTIVVHGNITYWKYADAWAFLSDDNGNVFDSQQLPNNATAQMKAIANAAKLNLTILRVWKEKDFTGKEEYAFFLQTYTDVDRDRVLHLHEYTQPEQPQSVGTLRLLITDFTEPVKNEYAGIYFSTLNGFTTKTIANTATSTYEAEISMYSSPQDVLISSYRNGVPVYHLVKNATANSNVTLDFDDFANAETIFEPKARIIADVLAYPDEGELGYRVASELEYEITGSTKPFSIGYPAVFKNYYSRIRSDDPSGLGKMLEKRGDPVTAYEFPALYYTVINPDITNFEMEISADATHKHGYWIGKNTSWHVFSPGSNRSVIKKIPDVIRKKYGDFAQISDLSLFRVAVRKYSYGNYYDWLDVKFGLEPSARFEEFSDEKQVR